METQSPSINTDFVVCLTLQNTETLKFSHHIQKVSVDPPEEGFIIGGPTMVGGARRQLTKLDPVLENECAVSASLTLPLVPSYAPSLCYLVIYYLTASEGDLVQRQSAQPEISNQYTVFDAFTQLVQDAENETSETITVVSWAFTPYDAANL